MVQLVSCFPGRVAFRGVLLVSVISSLFLSVWVAPHSFSAESVGMSIGDSEIAETVDEEWLFDSVDRGLAWFDSASEQDVVDALGQIESDSELRGVPLPGPLSIVQRILNAAWVFRDGYKPEEMYMQLAEVVVVPCIG